MKIVNSYIPCVIIISFFLIQFLSIVVPSHSVEPMKLASTSCSDGNWGNFNIEVLASSLSGDTKIIGMGAVKDEK